MPYAISRDSPYTHVAWMQALDLDFPLLSDWNAEATHGFGVAYEHNGMRDVSRRSAFLVDVDGNRLLDLGSGIAVTSIGHAGGTRVSIALVIAVALALWSASGGMAALVTGINVARDQTEPKSFAKKRGKALALTFGAIMLLVVMIFLIAAVPSILAQAGLGTASTVVPLETAAPLGGPGAWWRLTR